MADPSGGRPRGPVAAMTGLWRGVRGDWAALVAGRDRYFGQRLTAVDLPRELVTKVGLQVLLVARTAACLETAGLPTAARLASAALRHLYQVDIDRRAILEPGVSVIHGTGLVVGAGVRLGPGTVLLHDVTLDAGTDPDTGEVGAPTLEHDVHLGPGVTILGPVTIGARTKVMAGAVVTRSVPAGSLVRPAAPRLARGPGATGS